MRHALPVIREEATTRKQRLHHEQHDGTSAHPPGGSKSPFDLMVRGLMAPSGVRGSPKRVRLCTDDCRALTRRLRKPAVVII